MKLPKESFLTSDIPTSPFEYQPETPDENRLLWTLKVLMASGSITQEDVEHAWALTAY